MFHFVQWLNGTPFSTYLRESDWSFPIIESFHILALGASVGTIMWLDLCLLGIALRKVPAANVVEGIEPWAIRGFSVMFVSGFLLLLAEPLKCYTNWTFRLKMLGVLLAGLNVLYFHKKIKPNMDNWDQGLPWRTRMVGGVSLGLWFTIIVLGRWFAYF